MLTLRYLAIFISSALLTGCGTYCPTPGEPAPENETSCWYSMKVENIDAKRGEVTATISTRVKRVAGVDFSKRYTFLVRDLERLQLEKGKEYLFINVHNSPSLEAFPNSSGPITKNST